MKDNSQEVLHRFHRALVREVRNRNRVDLSEPLSIAEIYRDLIPHRTLGDELGTETHADYEFVLLRLLAGEGDYIQMGSQDARQEIRAELGSPTPDTGRYRDFARVEVHLTPDHLG